MEFHRLFQRRGTIVAEGHKQENSPVVPKGLVRKCRFCKEAILAEDVRENHYICPKCGGYFRMHALRRIESVADRDSFVPWFEGMKCENPLGVEDYVQKVSALQEKTKLDEAITTGEARIEGRRVALGVMDGRFLMASMGEVVGEKLTGMIERATKEQLPVIVFACSGGARMQEGMVSLMQMAKTSAALKRHHEAGQLYISVLTDPTTGGVTASFAMLGDIILAEPKALIGFAGPRVIEQTIGQKLPKGFQRSEFLLEHGFIDAVVKREELRSTLSMILKLHPMVTPKYAFPKEKKETDTKEAAKEKGQVSETDAVSRNKDKKKNSREYSAWERVLLSRKNDRPVGDDYIHALFDDFIEFHGDRYAKDDHAIIGGIARFHGVPVTVIAQVKGHNTKENIDRNFGMPSPDGYRKALRLMKEAQRFGRPIFCFVDTPGAFCGLEAEERGQGEAIARNLYEMSALTVPVLSIFIGEGGSGGALAMAVANEVWILNNAIYSILSPEGYASILWKDGKRAKEAAEIMKITAPELKELGVVDRVFPEPKDITVDNYAPLIQLLDRMMKKFLTKMSKLSGKELASARYERFRKF